MHTPASSSATAAGTSSTIQFSDLLSEAKQKLSPGQNDRLAALENAVTRGDVKAQQIAVYHQLAGFWKDSAHADEPYVYYTAEAAKLENSQKSLTFAARLFLDNLLVSNDARMQTWYAGNAKVLLEKALVLDPGNDSLKIGLGACYILGNISDNPMQGILPVREIATQHPDNLYAQMILGMGGKKSGQYDKAIERFSVIVKKEPANLEAIFQLAECYELKGDKQSAVVWYGEARKRIADPGIRKEIDARINLLK